MLEDCSIRRNISPSTWTKQTPGSDGRVISAEMQTYIAFCTSGWPPRTLFNHVPEKTLTAQSRIEIKRMILHLQALLNCSNCIHCELQVPYYRQ